MNYHDAIELQAHMFEFYQRPGMLEWSWGLNAEKSTRMVRRFDGYEAQYVETEDEKVRKLFPDSKRLVLGTLEAGETYYVSPRCCDLIESASKALPDEARLDATMFPGKIGVLFFDHPLKLPWRETVEGYSHPSHAAGFAWALSSDEQTAHVVLLVDWKEERERRVGEFPGVPDAAPLGVLDWDMRGTLGDAIVEATSERQLLRAREDGGLALADLDAFKRDPDGVLLVANHERYVLHSRMFVATIMFLSQEIITPTRQRVDRHSRKRLAKMSWRPEDVLVVELRRARRTDRADERDEPLDHAFRWWVSCHWRRLYDESGRVKRVVWVRPHIKGPEDRPIRPPSNRVFAVVR